MSGKAFHGTSPIKIEEWNSIKDELFSVLKSAGATNIVPVGTTGLKQVMGDIDLAIECKNGREGLLNNLKSLFDTRLIGNDIMSIKYPLRGTEYIQIDLMIGNVEFIKWSRAGSESNIIKNSCRAILFNTILRNFSKLTFESKDDIEKRYILDFGTGLYLIERKKNKKLSKLFITDKPEEIIHIIFNSTNVFKTKLFFGLVETLLDSDLKLWTKSEKIKTLNEFCNELKELSIKNNAYGDINFIVKALSILIKTIK